MFMTNTITVVTAIAADTVIILAKRLQAMQDTAGITAVIDSQGRLMQETGAKTPGYSGLDSM